MSETRDCSGDAAAYVLGALSPAEAEAFRAHLDTCVVCRDEVAALRPVVDVLPLTAPAQPVPRRLRRRLFRTIRAEPKAVEARAGPSGARWLGIPRPALAGLAAAAVAGLSVAGVELASSGASSRVIQASVVGLPGSAQLRVSGGQAQLIVQHFPPPPAGRVYEVWLKRAGHPPSPTSALFNVTSAGAASVGVPGSLSGVSQVLVTPEPAGGSLVPTHAPVIVAEVT